MNNTREQQLQNFDAISINLASPERIKEWSYGEVTKPETINYRTGRSERGGLFDERIFGPEKDYECYCGKYRRIRYKGIICEKCGVEVTKSIVRRERMGHIELASPVAHIWFLRGIPSRMALLLDITATDLEKVIYFAGYIVTSVNEGEKEQVMKSLDAEYKSKVKQLSDEKAKDEIKELLQSTKKEVQGIVPGAVLNEALYHKFSLKYGTVFEAGIGAEAIYDICTNIDLEKLAASLEERLVKAGAAERVKLQKRLSLLRSMIYSKTRPEWMFLTLIPVIPPGLRPMVALEGGRHATSDVNDLYRRVINRNNRLGKLKEISAPDVILRNEKRILQEAVDALLDNSMRHQSQVAMSQSQRRSLKSLADSLKGKQGYFRQNLLGKRVDYSGRSVIVVGSNLKLGQCGLPKHMALELFIPRRNLDGDESLSVWLESRGADGWLLPELAAQLAEAPDRLGKRLAERTDVWREDIEGTMWAGLRSAMDALGPKLAAAMADYLGDHPRVTAVPPATLRSAVCARLDRRIFRTLLDQRAAAGELEVTPEGVRPVGHRQVFSEQDTALAERVADQLTYGDKPPPKLDALARTLGLSPQRLGRFLGELERAGQVVRLTQGVYATEPDMALWQAQVQAFLAQHGEMTVAQFRDQAGIGRGFGIMVLEYLDHAGVTKRLGNVRVAADKGERQHA